MYISSRRSALAVPGAILLSLLIASQTLAAHTWSARIALTTSGGGFPFGVIGLNSTTAVAAYVEWNGSGYDVNVKRSTTSGSSWTGPITLSTDGYFPAISGMDPFVDVAWEQNGVVRYARSIDGGVSYLPSIALSNPAFPLDVSVARGAGGLVVVAWQNGNSNAIRARVSTDGGVSFGPTAAFTSNIQSQGTSVAAGDGVVYVAYKTRYYRLVVRRSLDGGATWSAPFVATSDAYGVHGNFSITAVDDHAYLAFTDDHPSNAWGTVRYRRTLDSGANWSSERNLAPSTWKTESPDIELQGGGLRAAFNRRGSGGSCCSIYYRQSTNGLTWATSEFVDSSGFDPSLTKAGNVIVLFQVGTGDAVVRTGS